MDRIEVSAPGKLVLIGEYAVLFGAPAAVAAVDRRAVVSLEGTGHASWEVSAPGLAPEPCSFDLDTDGAVRWHDEALGCKSFALVERLLGTLGPELLPPAALTLDTRAFFEPSEGGEKLGLGSSAALTVALAAALDSWGGSKGAARDNVQRLVELHRAVQGGRGSGIDVAASLLGGVVRYRLDAAGAVADTARLSLPSNLRMVFAWTGRSASTGDFLARLETRLAEAPGAVRPALDELGAVSAAGVAGLAEVRTPEFLDAVDAFWDALERLGGVIGMPILSDEHLRLRELAAGCGVRYKPSGAGGGDLGIGFTDDPTAAAGFAERVAAAGFRTLDLHVDPMGVAGMGP